ncbi:MAG: cytochrome c-type biogenesis protein CcmH [Acidimicrobiales bacterium]|nr:cytochrome c-type biogenesis protein CcmH [Acidimicrobiales bacterium]
MTGKNETAMPPPARPGRRVRAIGWFGLVLVFGVVLAVAATGTRPAATDAERVDAVAKTLRCPTCQGESVAVSEALISQEIRADIRRRLTAGESPDQIRAYYVSTYGEGILLTPSATGTGAAVWVLPVVVAVLCLAGLVVAFRRWRTRGALRATPADRALVEQALRADRPTDAEEVR